ncbi:MAG: TadG family pilus assembly protein [Planctomycetota bacterium]
MFTLRIRNKGPQRRAVSFVMVGVSLVMLLGMASLTVDVGMLYRARAEAQASADAAAMAGAWKLLDNDKLKGTPNMTAEIADARTVAAQIAALNVIVNQSPSLDANTSNDANGDIIVGYLSDPDHNTGESLSTANASQFNTVRVHVRRDASHASPIDLYFAGVFGRLTANISAEAYATFKDGVVGWKVTDNTGNAGLLPLALKVDAWNNLLAGTFTTGDNYSYDPATGTVSAGNDGINELNLYPGGGATQLPPGNFGTVDIGDPGNSTADLARQIRYGVSADDLAYYGGELKLGADGTLQLTGDTGLSAALKDDLTSIIGQPRSIPLFSTVAGPGNNSIFTIVGFACIRILDVNLTGSMSSKKVIVQPAFCCDDAVLTGPGSGSSYFVYQPVHLVR